MHDHGVPTAGLRRKAKKQFAPPPDDCVELADARPVIKSFYLTTQDASAKLEKVSKVRVGNTHTLLPFVLADLFYLCSVIPCGARFCLQNGRCRSD